jgi:two-component system sensor histidine kinase MprB
MSFRARLTFAATVAVAIVVVLTTAAAYVIVRGQLRGQVDDQLRARAQSIVQIQFPGRPIVIPPDRFFGELPRGPLGSPGDYVQLVTSDGQTARPSYEEVALPVDTRAEEVAAGRSGSYFSDTTVAGTHVRVLTIQLTDGIALQTARALNEVDRNLHRLGVILFFAGLIGVGLAVAIGGIVARTALAPVRRLTRATEHVAETRDLSQRIEVTGRDELSRLAASFNTMLGALDASITAQRQLVADASHELRTPITSVRTNIEVLAASDDLSPEERERLLADVVEQLEEMSVLVGDVVELARDTNLEQETEDVRLDLLVADALERARRQRPQVVFTATLEPSLVRGVPSRLERAIANLLDNAAKWSPPGGEVEVSVAGGEIVVRDHGKGITEQDLPFVFDRFYRAADARGLPGSGLGLAIVRQVAEQHGGTATAEQAEGGGARFRLRLPAEPAPGEPELVELDLDERAPSDPLVDPVATVEPRQDA